MRPAASVFTHMSTPLNKTLLGLVIALSVCCSVANAQTTSADIPRHLAFARQLVENTKPEDNRYILGGQFISFPGDPQSDKYAVGADCSGFLLAILARARYPTQSRMEYLPGSARKRSRPAAQDFVYSIEMERGFERIREATAIKPGDLLAHAMLNVEDQRQTGTTGHVFLIDSYPKAIAPKNPVVAGTRQFEVSVIDSNDEHVGADDTRLADSSNKITGLGRGTIRLYVGPDGEVVGWARTFKDVKRFFSYDPRFPSDTKPRKAAIGRPSMGG